MLRYFISDLHLSDKRLDLIQAFVYLTDELCQSKKPCELYILGDFFEAYIGDDYQPEWMVTLDQQFEKLAKSHVPTYFLAGNRDFLVGPQWLSRNNISALTDQTVIHQDTHSVVITHGDEFCVDDLAYQEFRTMVRQSAWQQQVLAMPLEQRMALAQKLREDSKSMSADKNDSIMDVNQQAINQSLSTDTSLLIHGHTHRPAFHETKTVPRLVLGDWDQYIWLATMDHHGIEQFQLSVASYLASPSHHSEWKKVHQYSW